MSPSLSPSASRRFALRGLLSVLAVILVAVAARLAPATGTVAAADPSPAGDRVALAGEVDGVGALDPGDVVALIGPTAEADDAAAPGDRVRSLILPQSAVLVDGSRFAIVLDPGVLPASAVGDTGLVDLVVYLGDPVAGRYAVARGSVRAVDAGAFEAGAVDEGAGFAWADPLAAVDLDPVGRTGPGGAVLRARLVDPAEAGPARADVGGFAPGSICRSDCRPAGVGQPPVLGLDRVVDLGASDELAARIAAPASSVAGPPLLRRASLEVPAGTPARTAAAASCPWPGAGDVYGEKKSVQATIGTSYPVGDDRAWMAHHASDSVEFSAVYGIADDRVGHYQEASTRAVSRSVGFTWDQQSYMRSYRVGLNYREVLHYFDRCPGEEPYYTSWKPVSYNGGFGENSNGLSRPDWTNCQKITSSGTWTRAASNGSSYSYSKGVKTAGLIGINLSSERAYNVEAKLNYRLLVAGRWLCGSDDDPAHAGKVMERFVDART